MIRSVVAFAIASAAISSSASGAPILHFVSTGFGTGSSYISFDIPAMPQNIFHDQDGGAFTVTNVETNQGGATPATYSTDYTFYLSDSSISNGGFTGPTGTFTGRQLFSGTIDQPTLLTGTFALTYFNDEGSPYNGAQSNLTVTPAATTSVPEPAIWTTMIAGFGVIGATMRRRYGRAAISAA